MTSLSSASSRSSDSPLAHLRTLPKCPTGVQGLDEITNGGLPQGRPTLVCGSTGSGKTLLAMEFLVRGVAEFAEPGVFMCFEETLEELRQNVASLGWDLAHLIADKKLIIDYVHIDPNEIHETGEYDLTALFIRLGSAIQEVGAKRVVLDTTEVLFAGFSDQAIVRSELRRLFRWLKTQGVTAIITAEQGEGSLTRHGIEEYVSDCVIRLDQQVTNELMTRRLRIVKYRGSHHGTNEYPFLIEQDGISVLPITSTGLDHEVSNDRISSGIPRLDTMLGDDGYYRGSSILVTGTAGTGKSTLAAHFARATCERGERCFYLAMEEAPKQIMRNMRSVGVDLAPYVEKGLLEFRAVRPTAYGLELHLAKIHRWLHRFQPSVVILDPMSNLALSGNLEQTKAFFMRLIDFLKSQGITVLLTNLTPGGSPLEHTEVGVSSLMDTWIEVRSVETNGERNRVLYVLKSRGMNHSNQVREFLLSSRGMELLDVYLGQGPVLTGSARLAQENQEQQAKLLQEQVLERKRREFARKQAVLQAQISALQAELESEQSELDFFLSQKAADQTITVQNRTSMAQLRQADQVFGK